MEKVDVECPGCGRTLSIPSQYAGQTGSCNHCGAAIQVPAPQGQQPHHLQQPQQPEQDEGDQQRYGGDEDPYGGYGGSAYDDLLGDIGGGGSVPPPVVVAQPRGGGRGGGGGGGADAVTWMGWGLYAVWLLMWLLQGLSNASAMRKLAENPEAFSPGPLIFLTISGLCFLALFVLLIMDAVRQGYGSGSVLALVLGLCCLSFIVLPWYLLGRNLPDGPWRLTGGRVVGLIGLILLEIALVVAVFAVSLKTAFDIGVEQGGVVMEDVDVIEFDSAGEGRRWMDEQRRQWEEQYQ